MYHTHLPEIASVCSLPSVSFVHLVLLNLLAETLSGVIMPGVLENILWMKYLFADVVLVLLLTFNAQ